MRKLFSIIFVLTAAISLAACGGSSSNSLTGTGGGGAAANITSVTLIASSPQVPSDGSSPVQISAFVRDSNNNFVEGVLVTFSATSGGLTVLQATTDANGLATAEIGPAGDPSNRTITVSGLAGNANSQVNVDVFGSQLSIVGSSSLVQNDVSPYTIVLTDSGGNGIPNEIIDLSSASGNTLSSTQVTTDSTGQATFQVTAVVAGADTITATGLGLLSTLGLTVSNDSFSFTAPAANAEINLGVVEPVTLNWTQGGAPQVGEQINFSATRGSLSAGTANTDGSGNAMVTISSTSAGPATITATSQSTGTTTQVVIEFVATTPASITVQANPFTIAPTEQSTITAIVRDANNNLVKNQTVEFQVQDVTGGSLTVGSAVTDSQGRAVTAYTASTTTSGSNGVVITATVQNTAITDTVALTVAAREVFISIGSGNEIFEPNTAQYRVEFAVQVTDAQGNGVEGVDVQMKILSDFYFKGSWTLPLLGDWVQNVQTAPPGCLDEDLNRNGVLDAGEDNNNSGAIEAGNKATVTPGSATTDASGFVLVNVFYPQEFARWIEVTLTATTTVQGTEFEAPSTFVLPIAATDVASTTVPPGVVSPFGASANCGDTM